VRRVATAEAEKAPGQARLADAVARNLHKLMAYKDEYEVARLYGAPAFRRALEAQFEGVERVELLLAPPIIAKPDPQTGRIQKRRFGPWIFAALRLLARLKGLRGGRFDPFGKTEERRTERALIGEYETICEALILGLDRSNHGRAVSIAEVPAMVRGFGHVKAANVAAARAKWANLMAAWPKPEIALAAE
jgi:indolepyruvate ferredoxin oxidoreductase